MSDRPIRNLAFFQGVSPDTLYATTFGRQVFSRAATALAISCLVAVSPKAHDYILQDMMMSSLTSYTTLSQVVVEALSIGLEYAILQKFGDKFMDRGVFPSLAHLHFFSDASASPLLRESWRHFLNTLPLGDDVFNHYNALMGRTEYMTSTKMQMLKFGVQWSLSFIAAKLKHETPYTWSNFVVAFTHDMVSQLVAHYGGNMLAQYLINRYKLGPRAAFFASLVCIITTFLMSGVIGGVASQLLEPLTWKLQWRDVDLYTRLETWSNADLVQFNAMSFFEIARFVDFCNQLMVNPTVDNSARLHLAMAASRGNDYLLKVKKGEIQRPVRTRPIDSNEKPLIADDKAAGCVACLCCEKPFELGDKILKFPACVHAIHADCDDKYTADFCLECFNVIEKHEDDEIVKLNQMCDATWQDFGNMIGRNSLVPAHLSLADFGDAVTHAIETGKAPMIISSFVRADFKPDRQLKIPGCFIIVYAYVMDVFPTAFDFLIKMGMY